MKKLSIYLAMVFMLFAGTTIVSCQKGKDDPIVSLKTRKDRFTNTWTLVQLEKNGATQDISGTVYTYVVKDNGTLILTIEGSIFGFPSRTVKSGTWMFLNDEEDVKITIEGDFVIYNVQRLASKELWLKEYRGGNIYVYYFSGL